MIASSVLYAGLVLVGIGTGGVISSAGGWRWLRRQFPHGLHGGSRDLGGFTDPQPTPPGWTPLLEGSVDDVRREYGRHARTQPRQPLTEQVIEVTEAPGHAPWSGSFPALDAEAEAEHARVKFARSQLEQHKPADITPEVLQGVIDSLRAMPVPAPGAGLSFDCGNGLHAPVCDGRNCSCSCHGRAPVYGEAPQLAVGEEQERLARGTAA